MRLLQFWIPLGFGLWLALSGVIESIQERDGTKLGLVFFWLSTLWLYWDWKKRAIKLQEELFKIFTEGGLYIREKDRIVRHPLPFKKDSSESQKTESNR